MGHSAEILTLIRKLTLNLLQLEPTRTRSIKASRLRAGWDADYLLRVLEAVLDEIALALSASGQRGRWNTSPPEHQTEPPRMLSDVLRMSHS